MNTVLSILKDYLVVLIISWIFILILESLGYYFVSFSQKLINKYDLVLIRFNHNSFGLNTLIGGIVWTMIMFFFGLIHHIRSEEVFIYSILFFILAFVRNLLKFKNYQFKLKLSYTSLAFIIGSISTYGILTFYAFKPVTSFDALWYHFPIPKAFLMQGNIDFLDNTTRYSVHPYMNFFWYLYFFALPKIPIVLKVLSINIFLINLIFISVLSITNRIRKDFNFSILTNFLSPILVGCLPIILEMANWGYNDMFGYCYGIGLFIVFYNILRQSRMTIFDLFLGLLMCSGLFMLKIFFAVLGFVGVIILCYKFLELNNNTRKNLITLMIILSIIFTIFILPWLVRSYLWTGKILYPIGAPGMMEDAYQFIGAENSSKFWGDYWSTRFANSFFGFWITIFSPLVLISIISVFYKIEKWLKELIFIGLFSFYLTYIINIVGEARYLMATIPFLVIPGLIALNHLYNFSKITGGMLSITLLIVILISPIRAYITNDHKIIDDFYNKKTTIDKYMELRTTDYNVSYYRNANTLRPDDLADNDPIIVYKVERTGYIDNPIIDVGVHRQYLNFNQNFIELNNQLKRLKVKYILTRDTPNQLCKETQTKDIETCNNLSLWSKTVYDDQNKIWWWKIN
jgi:hypothetical protein